MENEHERKSIEPRVTSLYKAKSRKIKWGKKWLKRKTNLMFQKRNPFFDDLDCHTDWFSVHFHCYKSLQKYSEISHLFDMVSLTQYNWWHDPHVFRSCETHITRLLNNDRCQCSYWIIIKKRFEKKKPPIKHTMLYE